MILYSFTLFAEEFTINKHEASLDNLNKQYEKAQDTLDDNVRKAKQKILESYYNDLERHFNYQMKTKNLDLANKINAKKEKIFAEFKAAQEKTADKQVTAKTESKKSKSVGFLGPNRRNTSMLSNASNEFKILKVGELCFKKGGDYPGSETWKELPNFLEGKLISFLSHEKKLRKLQIILQYKI